MNRQESESLDVAQIDSAFEAKYGLDISVPSSLDYLKLLADAGEADLTEEWVSQELEKRDACAIRQEDGSVLMFDLSWKIYHEVSALIKEYIKVSHVVLPQDMLDAEKAKLKQWAADQGLSAAQVQECWSNAFWTEKTMVASVTPKRLEVFRSEILKKIKENRDVESGSNTGDLSGDSGVINELDSGSIAEEEQGGSEEDSEAGCGAGEPEQQCGSAVLYNGEELEGASTADTEPGEPVQVGQKFPLEFTEFLAALTKEEWHEIDQYYYENIMDAPRENYLTTEDIQAYLFRCWKEKVPFFPGYKYPDAAAMVPEKINEDTGEVKVDGLLLSLGLTEFPTLDHPEIDRIIEEVGRRIALDKAEVEIRRKNCEDKCKQLLKHAEGYELAFGELISQHAAKQLKRSKKTGKIYGTKTVVYETFCVSFEKSGGIWVGDKKKLDAHFLEDEKARKTYGVTLETVPKYENKHVLDIISERGKQRLELQEQISNLTIMLEKSGDPEIGEKLKELEEALKNVPPLTLPGVTDAPVNEIAKWEIKPTKESKKQ